MNNEFWLPVLTDGLFAAIAAIGFAVISNPPKRAISVVALLGAFGHACRFYLLHYTPVESDHIFTLCSFRNRDAKYVSRPPRPVSGGSIFFSGSTSHDPRYVCL